MKIETNEQLQEVLGALDKLIAEGRLIEGMLTFDEEDPEWANEPMNEGTADIQLGSDSTYVYKLKERPREFILEPDRDTGTYVGYPAEFEKDLPPISGRIRVIALDDIDNT